LGRAATRHHQPRRECLNNLAISQHPDRAPAVCDPPVLQLAPDTLRTRAHDGAGELVDDLGLDGRTELFSVGSPSA
jgi:hypothetical protein